MGPRRLLICLLAVMLVAPVLSSIPGGQPLFGPAADSVIPPASAQPSSPSTVATLYPPAPELVVLYSNGTYVEGVSFDDIQWAGVDKAGIKRADLGRVGFEAEYGSVLWYPAELQGERQPLMFIAQRLWGRQGGTWHSFYIQGAVSKTPFYRTLSDGLMLGWSGTITYNSLSFPVSIAVKMPSEGDRFYFKTNVTTPVSLDDCGVEYQIYANPYYAADIQRHVKHVRIYYVNGSSTDIQIDGTVLDKTSEIPSIVANIGFVTDAGLEINRFDFSDIFAAATERWIRIEQATLPNGAGTYVVKVAATFGPLGAGETLEIDPSVVGILYSGGGTSYWYQKRVFYANGRYWAFYADGSNYVKYRTSTDGSSWSSETTIRQTETGPDNFDIYFDGTYLHYAIGYGYPGYIYYRRGTPNSDGTITWSAAEQSAATHGNYHLRNTYITVGSDGKAWITYRRTDSDPNLAAPQYVTKNNNNDGTWSTASGFPLAAGYNAQRNSFHGVIPLTGGKAYWIYGGYSNYAIYGKLWDGSAWGTQETVASGTSNYYVYGDAVAVGDDVHIIYYDRSPSPREIRYNKRTYGSGWGSATTIMTSTVSIFYSTLAKDSQGNLYLFWGDNGDNNYDIKYRKKPSGGSWDASDTVLADGDALQYISSTADAVESQWLYDDRWAGQSFTPSTDIQLLAFGWHMRKSNSPTADVYTKIYLADANHKPTGSPIATSTRLASTISAINTLHYFVFSDPPSLSGGTEYVAVIHTTGGDAANSYYLYYKTGDPYSGGLYMYSLDGGSSWTTDSSKDRRCGYELYPTGSQSIKLTTSKSEQNSQILLLHQARFSGAVIFNSLSLNSDPVNGVVSISDLDDADNVYAQLDWYTVSQAASDADGYADVTEMRLRFKQSTTTRAEFKYDEDANSFSLVSGDWDLDTGASSASRSGNDITLTWKVKPQWDAVEEADLEIEAYVLDSASASDTDTAQTDYFDVVKTLTVSGFASDPADYVNPSASVAFSGTVYYVDNPGSSTPSTFYPPDAEFTSVSVHDASHAVKGTDSTVVNGVFTVSFTSDASVGPDTYHPYIDMADADYVDADVPGISDSVTVEQVQITLSGQHYYGIGDTAAIGHSAVYLSDSADATSYVAKTMNDTLSKSAVGNYSYTVSSITDSSRGITSFTVVSPHWIVFDDVEFWPGSVSVTGSSGTRQTQLLFKAGYAFNGTAVDGATFYAWDGATSVGEAASNSTGWASMTLNSTLHGSGTLTVNGTITPLDTSVPLSLSYNVSISGASLTPPSEMVIGEAYDIPVSFTNAAALNGTGLALENVTVTLSLLKDSTTYASYSYSSFDVDAGSAHSGSYGFTVAGVTQPGDYTLRATIIQHGSEYTLATVDETVQVGEGAGGAGGGGTPPDDTSILDSFISLLVGEPEGLTVRQGETETFRIPVSGTGTVVSVEFQGDVADWFRWDQGRTVLRGEGGEVEVTVDCPGDAPVKDYQVAVRIGVEEADRRVETSSTLSFRVLPAESGASDWGDLLIIGGAAAFVGSVGAVAVAGSRRRRGLTL